MSKTKSGHIAECPQCGLRKHIHGRGMCSSCYHKQLFAESGERYQKHLERSREYCEKAKKERQLPYKRGSWNDPEVQAHHQAMLTKYLP